MLFLYDIGLAFFGPVTWCPVAFCPVDFWPGLLLFDRARKS